MHKYIILFFLVMTFLCACSDSVPDGILPKPEMINVLTDVHLADGSLINITALPDTLYKYGTARYLAVFKKFHTDTGQFRRSYKYYTLHPALLSDVYDNVLKKLQVKSDSISKLLAKQNKNKPVMSTATGGRLGPPSGQVPVPARGMLKSGPMIVNPNQAAVRKYQARRDSMLKKRLKEKNALPKK
jgi:hypothetical protein